MNTQKFNQTHKTNFVTHAIATAAVIGGLLAGAPAASASTSVCGLNPASQGWVPVQVSMEYEARCADKGGALTAPAKTTPKAFCTLNPATQGWVPVQVSMEYEARCK